MMRTELRHTISRACSGVTIAVSGESPRADQRHIGPSYCDAGGFLGNSARGKDREKPSRPSLLIRLASAQVIGLKARKTLRNRAAWSHSRSAFRLSASMVLMRR